MIRVSDRRTAIALIDEAVQTGALRRKACAELDISERSYQRWTQETTVKEDGRPHAERPEPANKLGKEEREQLLTLCNQVAYRSLPPSQIVPALADQGIYLASESTFYRVLKEANQLHHRGKAQAPRQVAKPKSYRATAPNQVWSWDITYMASTITGVFFRLYLIMDIYSRKIVGWEIHEQEKAEYAAQLIRKASLREGVSEKGLVLHSDNGSPMKGATMLATLQRLGIVPSFSRPSVSNDNPYSESLFGTLKYRPAYPSQPFESIETARHWVYVFVRWYNEEHRHSGIRFVTPDERHQQADHRILAARKSVYEIAKRNRPERWSGETRNWSPIGDVWLNPENTATTDDQIRDKVA